MKKMRTAVSVGAMMCAVVAVLVFSIWVAVYGDDSYGFYKREYQKYEVTKDLDMSIDKVMYVTEHMMNYLIGKEKKLSVITRIGNEDKDFFNERDRMHMKDVKNLFLGGIRTGVICLILAVLILGWMKKIEPYWRQLFFRAYTMALGVWTALGMILGIAFYTDFTTCFTIFHQLVFTNNLWMFDPATDYMIRMLPEGFFSDMVVRISVVWVVLLLIIWIVLFLLKQREQIMETENNKKINKCKL